MNKKLIVGLGNYPKEYANTRHNIGFKIIDHLCSKIHCPLSYEMFKGMFGKIIINDNECYIAKPLTYMNLSGDFVSRLIDYLKIDVNNIIVVCDDINFDIGKIRIKQSGSSGGQKGLLDIIKKVSSEKFLRIKVGVGKPSNKNMKISDYVLSKFEQNEIHALDKVIDKTTDAILDYLKTDNIEQVMNKYN